MAFDFPNTPSVGDLFQDSSSGAVYRWNGYAWVGGVSQQPGVYLPLAGGVMTGALLLAADPVVPLGAATKQMVDTKLPSMGVTDGSNALTGQIGEVVQANMTISQTLTTAVQKDIASITFTPGDWDIWGEVWIVTSAAATLVQGGISSTSATIPTATTYNGARACLVATLSGGAAPNVLAMRPFRANITVPVTYYLIAYATFASGTGSATGNIIARRVR